jgi:HlyD family secretion protein
LIKRFRQLLNLLTIGQRKDFIFFQVLLVIMSFLEVIGIASIIPFMTLVGDMSVLRQDTLIAKFYYFSGFSSENDFVFLLGIGVFIFLFIASIFSMFSTWKLSMFAFEAGAEISNKLYNHYLSQNWMFHTAITSAEMSKKITVETGRITGGVLLPFMLMNARLVFVLFLAVAILIYDPIISLTGILIILILYLTIYRFVKNRLNRNGMIITKLNRQRFRLMNNAFGGIKDLLLLGRGNYYKKHFFKVSEEMAISQGNNTAMAAIPRYIVEIIAFGLIMLLLLTLFVINNGNLSLILPVLSVYALAGFKLLPSFQQIYSSFTTIKANISAFDEVFTDLKNYNANADSVNLLKENKQNIIQLKKNIALENISFSYPSKKELVLNNVNMKIPFNSVVGVVGPSGAGKSTLIDIILGLIKPQYGKLKIDGNVIDDIEKIRAWQNNIAYVSQNIFLSEQSIEENIAFGIDKNEIDQQRLVEVINYANLTEFIKSLENKINTQVGERGVRLSGGQKQRIGIARALYNKKNFVIFDEATSSLDGFAEKKIMDTIYALKEQKTIILIAHRLKTVEKCDLIFFMDKGKIIDQGTYHQLIEKNETFRNLTQLA